MSPNLVSFVGKAARMSQADRLHRQTPCACPDVDLTALVLCVSLSLSSPPIATWVMPVKQNASRCPLVEGRFKISTLHTARKVKGKGYIERLDLSAVVKQAMVL